MLQPALVTAPGSTPVSLAEAKAHCRVDSSDDDALISALITAATAWLDGYIGTLGRCLVDQTWRIDFENFPSGDVVTLPFPKCSSVVVKYFDTTNIEQTVSSSLYAVFDGATGSFVRFTDAFDVPTVYDDRPDAVQVTFIAGYGAATEVPQPIKQAIFLMVGHWYEHREETVIRHAVNEIPFGVDVLIAPYRMVRF